MRISRVRAKIRDSSRCCCAKSLEQLLGSLHRMQSAAPLGPEVARELREGALVAVQLADRIRAIDEQISPAMCGQKSA